MTMNVSENICPATGGTRIAGHFKPHAWAHPLDKRQPEHGHTRRCDPAQKSMKAA